MAHFGFSFSAFFDAIGHVTYHDAKGTEVVKDFLTPGLRYKPPYGALDLISLGVALIFGTAGLPHILVRFYTVPDAKTARHSVVWAMVLIGSFYIMTTFLGFGAATIVGQDFIKTHGGTNMSAPLLAQALAGNIFFAFISAIAFATILGGGGWTDDQRFDFVCARFLDQRDSQGSGADAGRGSACGPGGGIRGGLRRHRDRDSAGADGQRGVPGGAGLRGGGLGEPAGDRAVDLLEAL